MIPHGLGRVNRLAKILRQVSVKGFPVPRRASGPGLGPTTLLAIADPTLPGDMAGL